MERPPRRLTRREKGEGAKRPPTRPASWWRRILFPLLALFAGGLAVAAIVLFQAIRTLPPIGTLTATTSSSVIYDVHDKPFYTLHGSDTQIPVPITAIPSVMQNAIIATEDASFYQNMGFSVTGIIRAALVDIAHGFRPVQGASTITEQLAKNMFLTDRKTVTRKLKQVILAIELERQYTKPQILDMYLNTTFFGEGAVGIQAASQIYFGIPASQLNLAQASLLAGLPQAPSAYDPCVNPQSAKTRQGEVLGRMAHYGYITSAQEAAAKAAPLHLVCSSGASAYPAPYFIDTVLEHLRAHGFTWNQIYNGGLQIYTTINPKVQNAAQSAMDTVMNGAFGTPSPNSTPQPQAAIVVMDPHNGYVEGLIGGRTHPTALAYNRATQAYRQSGSSIKPLAEYSTAVSQGYTQMTVLNDAPWFMLKGKPWPHNDNYVYHGRMTMRHALAISDNNYSVRLLHTVGVQNAFNMATQKFGLPLLAGDNNLAMGIGGLTRGVTPLQMTDAYATFANNGLRPNPVFIRKVTSLSGSMLYQHPPSYTPVLTPQQNYIMVKLLEGVVHRSDGTGYGYNEATFPQGFGWAQGGKTGTSSGGRDGWFLGITPKYVAGVWEGNDSGLQQQPNGALVYGATYAAPMWRLTLMGALKGSPPQQFTRPSGIVRVAVSNKSGLLPGPFTPPRDIKTSDFVQGTQPATIGHAHVQATVLQSNPSVLWDPSCGGTPTKKVFLARPSGNPLTSPTGEIFGPGIPLPIDSNQWVPTQYCSGGGPAADSSPSLSIQNGALSATTITVPQNTSVTLTLINQDTTDYTFTLSQFNISGVAVPAGGATPVTFYPDTSGSFGFVLTPSGGGTPLSGQLVVAGPTPTTAPPAGNSSPGGGNNLGLPFPFG